MEQVAEVGNKTVIHLPAMYVLNSWADNSVGVFWTKLACLRLHGMSVRP